MVLCCLAMKRVAGVGALISVAHSVYVYIRSREETPKSFQVGTVNDMILNRLKPGSILLYNRPWYEYYVRHLHSMSRCQDYGI